MRTNFMCRAAVLSWCAGAAVSLYAQQPKVAAHILDLKGSWRLDGATIPAASGQSLVAGAKITAISNHPGDAITILHDEDMSRQYIACDSSASNPCRNPIVVQGVSSPATTVGSQLYNMMEAALSILLDRPPAIANQYATTLSRGMTIPPPVKSEAVIALDPSQGIQLPPPPPEMPAGPYSISIARAGERASATALPGALTSDGTWKPLPWKATGLYTASIRNAEGKKVADTMLLVVPLAQYEAKRVQLDAMKGRTATWTGPDAQADAHLFLRAFLVSASTTE